MSRDCIVATATKQECGADNSRSVCRKGNSVSTLTTDESGGLKDAASIDLKVDLVITSTTIEESSVDGGCSGIG